MLARVLKSLFVAVAISFAVFVSVTLVAEEAITGGCEAAALAAVAWGVCAGLAVFPVAFAALMFVQRRSGKDGEDRNAQPSDGTDAATPSEGEGRETE